MLHKALLVLVLLVAKEAKATDGLWLTSKAEVGYNEYFVVGGFSIEQEGITKATAGGGIKARLSDLVKIEPTCGITMDKQSLWKVTSYFKIKLEIKL